MHRSVALPSAANAVIAGFGQRILAWSDHDTESFYATLAIMFLAALFTAMIQWTVNHREKERERREREELAANVAAKADIEARELAKEARELAKETLATTIEQDKRLARLEGGMRELAIIFSGGKASAETFSDDCGEGI